MGLSLLEATFSSTIISRCTCNLRCAGVCEVVTLAVRCSTSRMLGMIVAIVYIVIVMVMMIVMYLWVMVKVCAAVYLLIPHLALAAWL